MPSPTQPRLKVNPIVGRRPVLQNCTIAELQVDPAYQRSVDTGGSRTLIVRIARDWDWRLCHPLVVARRADGGLYVVDGQHRLEAARLRRDIYDLPCVVTEYASEAEEAASFVALNQQRRPLGALDLFKASLAGADRDAEVIMEMISQAGLSLAPHGNFITWKPGMISNIGGIQRCHAKAGSEIAGRALRVLGSAFEGQVLRYGGTIFAGIWPVIAELGDSCDDELLVFVLKSDDQAGWIKAIQALSGEQGIHRNLAASRVIRASYDETLKEMEDEAA